MAAIDQVVYQQSPKRRLITRKRGLVLLIIIGAWGILGIVVFSLSKSGGSTNQNGDIVEQQPSSEWKTYEENGLSFDYPGNAVVEQTGKSTTIYSSDVTSNSDYSEGYTLTIYKEELNNRSINSIAQDRVDALNSSEVARVTSGIEQIELDGHTGVMFQAESGLGAYTEMFFNVNDNSYLNITYSIQNAENGQAMLAQIRRIIISNLE